MKNLKESNNVKISNILLTRENSKKISETRGLDDISRFI